MIFGEVISASEPYKLASANIGAVCETKELKELCNQKAKGGREGPYDNLVSEPVTAKCLGKLSNRQAFDTCVEGQGSFCLSLR